MVESTEHMEPTPESDSGGSNPKQEVKREVVELVKMVVLFLIMFWGLKTFVIEGYEVQGQSMFPTLEDRERILVFKLPHKLSQLSLFGGYAPIEASDIVVFESMSVNRDGEKVKNNKRYIKRVIARGPKRTGGKVADAARHGEDPGPEAVKVEFDGGKVYVQNHKLAEPYLDPQERKSPDHRRPLFLDAGEYYVLGDHRGVSKDSRSFGTVDDEQIIGRAVFRFWPLSKFGPL